ncbi:sugar-transfer associated ATP-grasp domain-containing protein [Halolamina sp. C58]|uniref:sugar-transfer associated ATP-grasp domain-containing protein n=1 Tax=Halolamina sp. C58 TaxID=3421640 RepID=UPI003EBA0394
MVNWRDQTSVLALLLGLLLATLYLRTNVPSFLTVTASITFVFQLMLAGTVIAILRNEAGMSTFGVFGPAILAFAWVEVGPLWGFLMIAYPFVVTVTARTTLTGLDLGTPHRVAALLVITGIAVFTMQAVGQVRGIPSLNAVLLFPIILTTWYAERFVESVVETGWAPASRRLTFTLVGVVAAALVAGADPIVSFVSQNPESWVGLAAINIFLGAGTNIRLGEYLRFRRLTRSLGDDASGILTMRTRNRDFISRYNPAPLMSGFTKVKMKRLLHGLDIPTPETFMLLDDESGLERFDSFLEEHDRFVVKPADGSGGRGVLVVRGRAGSDGAFTTNRGELTREEVVSHARNICVGGNGDYGARNSAIVEAVVDPDGLLASRVESGVPDLRVIVLQGIPIMAMSRLPTVESKGTANIHTGAVAVAVDIASGTASGGYQQTRNAFVDTHPDTGASLEFRIPNWESVLQTASRASIASGFGYTGVDIVFDADRGPMVLEVNRRPGLGIQNANMDGLLRRLRFAESRADDVQFVTAHERVRRAMWWAEQGWEATESENPPAQPRKQEVRQ